MHRQRRPTTQRSSLPPATATSTRSRRSFARTRGRRLRARAAVLRRRRGRRGRRAGGLDQGVPLARQLRRPLPLLDVALPRHAQRLPRPGARRARSARSRSTRVDVVAAPGDLADEVALTASVEQAMRALSPEDRDAFSAVALFGLTYAEVAETLGVPVRDREVARVPRAQVARPPARLSEGWCIDGLPRRSSCDL